MDEKTEEQLKEVFSDQFEKLQRQSMLLGAQTICSTIREKIYKFESQSGRLTLNDYRRFMKDIKSFCEVGLSRKVNADGETETEPVEEESVTEETIQN